MDSPWHVSVDAYIARYGWQLLDREEFVQRIQAATDQNTPNKSLHTLILCIYSRALFHACSGAEGQLRQEQGYSELTNFLDRIATRRYVAVRADATQRALISIYQTFVDCRQPETFLAFALQKLRDAARTEYRSLNRIETQLSLDLAVQDGGWEAITNDQDPANIAIQNDTRRRLIAFAHTFQQEHPRAVQQLAVIWLGYLGGLDNRAIAKQLNKTTAAVEVLRSRGIARLRCDPTFRALAAELGFMTPLASPGSTPTTGEP